MNNYIIYTDGSWKPSLNRGGFASVILLNNNIVDILFWGCRDTTNNRQELLGVLSALEYFKTPQNLHIYSDSSYIVNSINGKYLDQWILLNDDTKKNMDLWEKIYKLLQFHSVTIEWVKGHNKNKYNELADLYANMATEFYEGN